MNTTLKVLLEADRRLEGDVADDKYEPLVCQQLNEIYVLEYFFLMAGFMDYQHVLRPAVFFLYNFLPQWLHCFGKQGRVASGR